MTNPISTIQFLIFIWVYSPFMEKAMHISKHTHYNSGICKVQQETLTKQPQVRKGDILISSSKINMNFPKKKKKNSYYFIDLLQRIKHYILDFMYITSLNIFSYLEIHKQHKVLLQGGYGITGRLKTFPKSRSLSDAALNVCMSVQLQSPYSKVYFFPSIYGKNILLLVGE